MQLTASFPGAQRLLPRPVSRGMEAPQPIAPVTAEAVKPAPFLPRATVWTLSRETGAAAVCVQMLAGQKRGLKADAMERARYARAYRNPIHIPSGLVVAEQA